MFNNKREIVLLGTAISLGAWVFLQIGGEPAASVRPLATPDPVVPIQPSASHFELAPVEDFDEIVARPLFTSTRRPTVAAPMTERVKGPIAAPKTATPPAAFELTGVVLEGEHAIALIAYNGKTNHVRYGDAVAGWRLETVEGERVVLGRGAQQIELELRSFTAGALPSNPRHPAGTARRANTAADDAFSLTEDEREILERLSDQEKQELLELLYEQGAATEDVRTLRPRSTN